MSKITCGKGTIIQGDCAESLKTLPKGSVQTCVTSPPYWQLRSYAVSDKTVDNEIGRESTPDKYVENIVKILREVKRVLRDDGTLWFNIGDSFHNPVKLKLPDIKAGELIGMPWKIAFALRDDGWYIKSDIIWSKVSFMPTSVKVRPAASHEHIFLLAKSKRYYYDQYSILTPKGAFPRDVWVMNNSHVRKMKHYAMFPIELPLRCIKAGTSEYGACAKCGTPYQRVLKVVKKDVVQNRRDSKTKSYKIMRSKGIGLQRDSVPPPPKILTAAKEVQDYRETIGWKKQCTCKTDKTKPCIVLDPFMGGGTAPLAAEVLNRRWIGLELYKANCKMALRRLNAHETGSNLVDTTRRKGIKKLGFSRRS